jgi:hypothetical protein
MKQIVTISLCGLALAAIATWLTAPYAYERHNDGCNGCHGVFTGSTTQKGTVFPGGDKHRMHRSSQYMDTACDLCHRSDDGNNPYIGSSDGDGTGPIPEIGCNGCHEPYGLRLHHENNSVTCSDASCHTTPDPTPPPENQKPAYYGLGSPWTEVDNPCNDVAQSQINENWSLGDFLGLDTDGDNDYDGSDANCGATATPGESGASASMIVTNFDKGTGNITISYTDACETNDSNIEYGDLANVASYTYSSSVCDVGDTGSATFNLPAGSYYFMVVGDNGSAQGSYGLGDIDADGTLEERPDNDTNNPSCPIDQDLTARCD